MILKDKDLKIVLTMFNIISSEHQNKEIRKMEPSVNWVSKKFEIHPISIVREI